MSEDYEGITDRFAEEKATLLTAKTKGMEGNIKSSGERRDFGTGAHRDSNTKVHKGRMDLVPGVAMRRFAKFLTGEDTNPHGNGLIHALSSYNAAIESLYLWLEGERDENDGGLYRYDHLSNALVCCQEIMHIDEDIPMWYPTVSPEYINGVGLRYDRISPTFLRRVSVHYQLGGINYGDRNWELGMPAMVTWDSATRHMTNWLEKAANDTEDHMAAFGWNIMCTMHTIEMVRRGILEEDMYQPPMHRNIQKGIEAVTINPKKMKFEATDELEKDLQAEFVMGEIISDDTDMIQPDEPWERC